jgi:hypothetical protein
MNSRSWVRSRDALSLTPTLKKADTSNGAVIALSEEGLSHASSQNPYTPNRGFSLSMHFPGLSQSKVRLGGR